MKDGDRVRITEDGMWIATQKTGQHFELVPAGATGTLRQGFDYQHRFMDGSEPMDCHLNMWHIEFDKHSNRQEGYCCGLGMEIPDWVERIEE